LDFEHLPALEVKASSDTYNTHCSDATYSIVDVGADDKAFSPAALAVVYSDDVTGLPYHSVGGELLSRPTLQAMHTWISCEDIASEW
jgi:hypothetical protein